MIYEYSSGQHTLSLTVVGATSGSSVSSSTKKKFLNRAAQYSQQTASGTPTRTTKRNCHLFFFVRQRRGWVSFRREEHTTVAPGERRK